MKNFSDDHIAQIAARSRALADVTRVRILALLSNGEQHVGQIADTRGMQQKGSDQR